MVGRRERGGDTAARPAAGGSGRGRRPRAPGAGRRQYAAGGARRLARGPQSAHPRRRRQRRLGLEVPVRAAPGAVPRSEQGTRWVLLEHNGPATWQRARAQVEAFLDSLAAQGAFAGAEDEQTHFVIADERVNRRETLAEGKFHLLFGFATSKPGELDTWLVTHRAGASRVRPVSVNRSATSRQRVEWEIETAILRGP